jgi:hypothetical protein
LSGSHAIYVLIITAALCAAHNERKHAFHHLYTNHGVQLGQANEATATWHVGYKEIEQPEESVMHGKLR